MVGLPSLRHCKTFSQTPPSERAFYIMVEQLASNLLILSKCGTNKIQVHTYEGMVWFSLLGSDNDPFFSLTLIEWDILKSFVENNLNTEDVKCEIVTTKQGLLQ